MTTGPDWTALPSAAELVAAAQARHAASTRMRDLTGRPAVDPAWDEAARRQIHDTVAALFRTVDGILRRRRDPHSGGYAEPDGITQGDVTGLARAVLLEVVDPIRAALDQVTDLIGDTVAAVDRHKRAVYGPGYQPDRSTWPQPRTSRGHRGGGAAP